MAEVFPAIQVTQRISVEQKRALLAIAEQRKLLLHRWPVAGGELYAFRVTGVERPGEEDPALRQEVEAQLPGAQFTYTRAYDFYNYGRPPE